MLSVSVFSLSSLCGVNQAYLCEWDDLHNLWLTDFVSFGTELGKLNYSSCMLANPTQPRKNKKKPNDDMPVCVTHAHARAHGSRVLCVCACVHYGLEPLIIYDPHTHFIRMI